MGYLHFTRPERLSTSLYIVLWGMLVEQKATSRADDILPADTRLGSWVAVQLKGKEGHTGKPLLAAGYPSLPKARLQ